MNGTDYLQIIAAIRLKPSRGLDIDEKCLDSR